MLWTKRGNIFALTEPAGLRRSHTQLPVVDTRHPGGWRIYFSSRDADNCSRPFHIEVATAAPERVIGESREPLLALGAPFEFDEHGVMPTAIWHNPAGIYLYYIGWSRRSEHPYRNAIGVAISDDGGRSFHKYPGNPLFPCTAVDPLFTGTLGIQDIDGLLHGYYMSATQWLEVDGRTEPRYHLRIATSRDGLQWERDGRLAIDYHDAGEGGIVSASPLALNGAYVMWFACRRLRGFRHDRASSYRIGYAQSGDGVHWQRRDELAGIAPGDRGWDSEMICYPCVVRDEDRLFMFYNGNGFGRSGIGYATCELHAR